MIKVFLLSLLLAFWLIALLVGALYGLLQHAPVTQLHPSMICSIKIHPRKNKTLKSHPTQEQCGYGVCKPKNASQLIQKLSTVNKISIRVTGVCKCHDGYSSSRLPCDTRTKSQLTAFLLSFFLGAFGVDWYYLSGLVNNLNMVSFALNNQGSLLNRVSQSDFQESSFIRVTS